MLILADSTTAVVAISMLGRFFVTFSVNTVMQQTYEIMPTELRAQGVSLSRCLSQFARIFSSYVVFSVSRLLQSVGADLPRNEIPFPFQGGSNPAIPFYILGSGGVLSGMLR